MAATATTRATPKGDTRVSGDAPVLASDPVQSAKEAGLRYVSDDVPGIGRRKRGTGFQYLAPDGSTVSDRETLARVKALVIPPAWADVWICRDPRGHIQATGLDAKGRKQYRYHPKWHAVRDEIKFARMVQFGQVLPAIRARADADMHGPASRAGR